MRRLFAVAFIGVFSLSLSGCIAAGIFGAGYGSICRSNKKSYKADVVKMELSTDVFLANTILLQALSDTSAGNKYEIQKKDSSFGNPSFYQYVVREYSPRVADQKHKGRFYAQTLGYAAVKISEAKGSEGASTLSFYYYDLPGCMSSAQNDFNMGQTRMNIYYKIVDVAILHAIEVKPN